MAQEPQLQPNFKKIIIRQTARKFTSRPPPPKPSWSPPNYYSDYASHDSISTSLFASEVNFSSSVVESLFFNTRSSSSSLRYGQSYNNRNRTQTTTTTIAPIVLDRQPKVQKLSYEEEPPKAEEVKTAPPEMSPYPSTKVHNLLKNLEVKRGRARVRAPKKSPESSGIGICQKIVLGKSGTKPVVKGNNSDLIKKQPKTPKKRPEPEPASSPECVVIMETLAKSNQSKSKSSEIQVLDLTLDKSSSNPDDNHFPTIISASLKSIRAVRMTRQIIDKVHDNPKAIFVQATSVKTSTKKRESMVRSNNVNKSLQLPSRNFDPANNDTNNNNSINLNANQVLDLSRPRSKISKIEIERISAHPMNLCVKEKPSIVFVKPAPAPRCDNHKVVHQKFQPVKSNLRKRQVKSKGS